MAPTALPRIGEVPSIHRQLYGQPVRRNRKKQTTPSPGRIGAVSRDGSPFHNTDYVTARDGDRRADKSLEDSDGFDETLDEITWGCDASGSPVIPRQYGNLRARPRTVQEGGPGGDIPEKTESKHHYTPPRKNEPIMPKQKIRRTKEKHSVEKINARERLRDRKPLSNQTLTKNVPHKITKRRKYSEQKPGAPNITVKTSSPKLTTTSNQDSKPSNYVEALSKQRGRLSAVGQRMDSPPKGGWSLQRKIYERAAPQRQHSAELKINKSPKICTADDNHSDQELRDNRSETSMVCKRDSWIWFSPETRPSIENFASRQQKFQSKDPRVAALAEEIRRQEELNRDIERTAESLIDSSSLSSKKLQKASWESNRSVDSPTGKHRIPKTRHRERARLSPYTRPYERYHGKIPGLVKPQPEHARSDKPDSDRASASPSPRLPLRLYGWQLKSSRKGARAQEPPISPTNVKKTDREIPTKSGHYQERFSPIVTEVYPEQLKIKTSHGSSTSSLSSSLHILHELSSTCLLSARSQPIFYYNSPAAAIIQRSPTPGRYSPLYDNSTLMTSRTCSPTVEEERAMRLIQTRSTQTTPQLYRCRSEERRKAGMVSRQSTHHHRDVSPARSGKDSTLPFKKSHKRWPSHHSQGVHERHSGQDKVDRADSPSGSTQETTLEKGRNRPGTEMKGSVTLRAIRDSSSPSGFRAIIDIKSPPASKGHHTNAHSPGLARLEKSSGTSPVGNTKKDTPRAPEGKKTKSLTKLSPKHASATDSPKEHLSHGLQGASNQPPLKTSSLISLHQTDSGKATWRKSPTMTLSTGESESESYYKDKPSAETSFRQVLISKEVNTTIHKLLFDTEQSSSSLSPSGKLKSSVISKQSEREKADVDQVQKHSPFNSPVHAKPFSHKHFHSDPQLAATSPTAQENQDAPTQRTANIAGTTTDKTKEQPELRASSSFNRPGRLKRTNIYTRDYYLGKKVALKKQQEAFKKPQEAVQENPSSRWRKTDSVSSKTARLYSPSPRTSPRAHWSEDNFMESRDTRASENVQTESRELIEKPEFKLSQNRDRNLDAHTRLPTERYSSEVTTPNRTTSPDASPGVDSSNDTEAPQSLSSTEQLVRPEVNKRAIHQPSPVCGDQHGNPNGSCENGKERTFPRGHSDPVASCKPHESNLYEVTCRDGESEAPKERAQTVTLHKCTSYDTVRQSGRKPAQSSSSVIPIAASRKRAIARNQSAKHAESGSTNNSSSNLPYSTGRLAEPCRRNHSRTSGLPQFVSPGRCFADESCHESAMVLAKDPHIDVLDHLQLCVEPLKHCSAKKSDKNLSSLGVSPSVCREDIQRVINIVETQGHSLSSGQLKFSGTRRDPNLSHTRHPKSSSTATVHNRVSCVSTEEVVASNVQLPPTSSDEEDMSVEWTNQGKSEKDDNDTGNKTNHSFNHDSGYDECMSERMQADVTQPPISPPPSQIEIEPGQIADTLVTTAGHSASACKSLSSCSETSHSSDDFAQRSRTSNDCDSDQETFHSIAEDGFLPSEGAQFGSTGPPRERTVPQKQHTFPEYNLSHETELIKDCALISLLHFESDEKTYDKTSLSLRQQKISVQLYGENDLNESLTADQPGTSREDVILSSIADISKWNQEISKGPSTPPKAVPEKANSDLSTFQGCSGKPVENWKESSNLCPALTHVSPHKDGHDCVLETPINIPQTGKSRSETNLLCKTRCTQELPTQIADTLSVLNSCPETTDWSANQDVPTGILDSRSKSSQDVTDVLQDGASSTSMFLPQKANQRENTLSSISSFSESITRSSGLDILECVLETSSKLSLDGKNRSDDLSVSSSPLLSYLQAEDSGQLLSPGTTSTDFFSTESWNFSGEGNPQLPRDLVDIVALTSPTGVLFRRQGIDCEEPAKAVGKQNKTLYGQAFSPDLLQKSSYPHNYGQSGSYEESSDTDWICKSDLTPPAHSIVLPRTSSDEEDDQNLDGSRNIAIASSSEDREGFIFAGDRGAGSFFLIETPEELKCNGKGQNKPLRKSPYTKLGSTRRGLNHDIQPMSEAQRRALIPTRSLQFEDLLKRF